ncbi:BPSL0761 family protein [Burkholderia sola]|uniref:BPSL0761 family protein n=1 Tax=Burkholderia sola TaxID=2843302 RepID=UPI001C0A8B5F
MELMMTTPCERTKAVTDTRELLQILASGHEVAINGLVQTLALRLLRHYPLDLDLDVSAAALPGVWAAPQHRQTCPTVAPGCNSGALGQGDDDDIRS